MATPVQQAQYNFHRTRCQQLGLLQSTFEHRGLMGSVGSVSGTGNTVYTGPGPVTADQIKTTYKVWAVTKPLIQRSGSSGGGEIEEGRQSIPMMSAQFPLVDDFGNAIPCAQDDLLIDPGNLKYRVHNPVVTPDASLWSMQLVKIR